MKIYEPISHETTLLSAKTPEQFLLLEILNSALIDYVAPLKRIRKSTQGDARQFEDAKRWIFDDTFEPFTIRWILDYISHSPEAALKSIREFTVNDIALQRFANQAFPRRYIKHRRYC